MNNKIYIFDGNGNKIVATAVSDIILSGDSFNNEYIFYTLNEVVNGDLTKVYVAKVNNSNIYIDDNEWENVKRSMLAIVHQETVVGLSYGSIVEDNGNIKTFNVQAPRKIALKMDKLLGLQDDYKIHSSSVGKNDNVPAFGNTEFFDKDAMKENEPQESVQVANPFNGSMDPIKENVSNSVPSMATIEPTNPVSTIPTVNVVETQPAVQAIPSVSVEPTSTIAPQPIAEVPQVNVESVPNVTVTPSIPSVTPTPVVNVQPDVSVTVSPVPTPVAETVVPNTPVQSTVNVTIEPAKEQTVGNDMKSLIPTPIPKAIDDTPAVDNRISIVDDEKAEEAGGFAIPVNPVKNTMDNMDSVIFDQIIEELNQIKNQNAEIQESIRKLTDNVANINTSLTDIEIKESETEAGIINTNSANTTEETPAINLSSNGSVIVPTFDEMKQDSTELINSSTNTQLINSQPINVINSPVEPVQNTLLDTSVNNTINTGMNQIISPTMEQPQTNNQVIEPIVQPVNTIEQPIVQQPVNSTPVNVVPSIPVIEPVTQMINNTPVSPAVNTSIETQGDVTYINQEPQIIPNTPMASQQPKADEPVIVVPEFDPNAGLPPVIMPQGVSAGDDSSIIGGVI